MKGTPKRQPRKKPTTRAERAKLPTCGANTRAGKPCKKPAGHGTDHPGEGKCRNHGGVGQRASTRYQLTNASGTLKAAVKHHQSDPAPMDVLSELVLARALLQDGIERHSATNAALIAWHASHTTGYAEAVALWREQLTLYLEAVRAGHSEPELDPPPPPIPEAFENRPRQLPDLAAFIPLIGQITGIVERQQKRDQERAIPLDQVERALNELGIKTISALREVIADDADLSTYSPAELRSELAGAIERHSRTVRL